MWFPEEMTLELCLKKDLEFTWAKVKSIKTEGKACVKTLGWEDGSYSSETDWHTECPEGWEKW